MLRRIKGYTRSLDYGSYKEDMKFFAFEASGSRPEDCGTDVT